MRGSSWATSTTRSAFVDTFRLEERFDHKPNQLSGGQQQRVSVARALMNGGDVILADEPTGALDSQSGKDMMALLKELHQQGHTIILVTHDMDVAHFADRIIEIKDGEIIADNPSPKAQIESDSVLTPLHQVEVASDTELEKRNLRINLQINLRQNGGIGTVLLMR